MLEPRKTSVISGHFDIG